MITLGQILVIQLKKVRPMWRKFLFKTILVVVLFVSSIKATSIITTAPGGTPTDGYQASTPVMSDGDVIRGHVMFKNGFEIPESGSIFYDADGPVFGNIFFNIGSTLQLGSDLRLGGTGNCWGGSASKIDAQGNAIVFGGDVVMNDHSSSILTPLTIDGAGHSLIISGNSQFNINPAATLTLKNMNFIIDAIGVDPIFNTLGGEDNFRVLFENVTIYLGRDILLFGQGSYGCTRIQGDVRLFGPYTASAASHNYDTMGGVDSNIFINENSTLYIGPGTTLNLDGLDVPSTQKIGMFNSTSRLLLDGCTLSWKASSTAGHEALQLQRGTVLLQDKVVIKNFALDGTTTNTDVSKGLIFGDGIASDNDVNVRVLGGAYVVLQGCMQYNHS